MAMTTSMQCKCGSGISVPFFQYSLIRSFTEIHNHCATEVSEDVDHEPRGDVFTQAERANRHSEHELTTGFQRQLW